MELTIDFGKADYRGRGRADCPIEVDVSLAWKDREARTIDLEPVNGYLRLAISGTVWNHMHTDCYTCGQCLDTLLELLPDDPLMQDIHEVWSYWHLNDLHAGTRPQRFEIEMYKFDNPGWQYDYEEARVILRRKGLLVDRGYRYGTAWLVELLPQRVISQVKSWREA